jgi:hypothetical protein
VSQRTYSRAEANTAAVLLTVLVYAVWVVPAIWAALK